MEVPQITVDVVRAHLEAGGFLLDVREVDEYRGAHVPGAVLIPLSELESRVGEVPDVEIDVICKTGGRSQRAAEYLASRGVAVRNVAGGTLAWIDLGWPTATGDEPGSIAS